MPTWRPNCLRGSIYKEVPQQGHAGDAHHLDSVYAGQHIDEDRRGTVIVRLQKKEGCGLGLTVAGGVDKGQRPQVSNLRPGSIAHRCDALMVGDYIISVNGIRTGSLKHDELINLLKNTGTDVSLEIEYEIPDTSVSIAGVVTKCQEVILEKEVNGFGLTLRGGMVVEKMQAHPLSVAAIRAGGPADREGSIQPGDHILAINGYKVSSLTLTETLSLFSQCDATAAFTVAYDVIPMEKASGPMLVEVFRPPGADLGLSLCEGMHEGKQCLCVDGILPMGIADRSGALRVGDYLLSIDNVGVENMSVAEAHQLLKSGAENHVRLEIVSAVLLEHCAQRNVLAKNSLASSFSSYTLPVSPASVNKYPQRWGSGTTYNTHNSHSNGYHDNNSVSMGASQFGTLNVRKRNVWSQGPERRAVSCMSIASSNGSVLSATNQVCRTETADVNLYTDGKGFGLSLKGGVFTSAPLTQPPTVISVEPRSPADMSGQVQEGDRIVNINGITTLEKTLDDINHFLRESRPRCQLLVEFDVAESVTPGSGTFIVKLAKRGGCTGITVHSSYTETGEILVVSDVLRGSVAHRCGSIQPGDQLISINDVRVDHYTADDAMHQLDLPDDIIKLKLKRDEQDEIAEGCIIYTVELERHGGPLGITISGTDDPLDPIVISELTPHGLAERTGAIHVGDRLLAVSGNPTKNKPLSEAIRMLQSAGDRVTLKIARLDPDAGHNHHHAPLYAIPHRNTSTPQPSVDSAMDSLSSSAHEMLPDSNPHVMVLAVPQKSAGDSISNRWTSSSSDRDGGRTSQNTSLPEWTSDHSMSSDVKESPQINIQNMSNESLSSNEMDDWVKTLEEFEMGSGSEMLKQIGLSLRQRSVMSLERDVGKPNRTATRSQSVNRVSDQVNTGKNSSNRLSMNSNAEHDRDKKSLERNQSMPGVHLSQEHRSLRDKPKVPQKPKIAEKPAVPEKPKVPPRPNKFPGSASLPNNVKPSDMKADPANNKSKSITKRPEQIRTVFTPSPVQIQRIVLEKAQPSEGFGFSLSDGLYDTGVFVSAVRKGGLAENAGLRMYDRVLKINKVKTKDFDCNNAIPLLQQAGKRLSLVVCRNPLLRLTESMRDEMSSFKNK